MYENKTCLCGVRVDFNHSSSISSFCEEGKGMLPEPYNPLGSAGKAAHHFISAKVCVGNR